MSKSLRMALLLLIGSAAMIVLYAFGTRRLDTTARQVWFSTVVRSLAHDRSRLDTTAREQFLLGLYRPELPYDFDRLYEIEDSLGASISIVSFYQAWGSGEEHAFPLDVCRNLSRGGFVPLITWEPWVVAFDTYQNTPPDSSLALITSGEFDDYIRAWAREAVRYGKPLYVRMAHEVSNGWYSWSSAHGHSPKQYREFWRHVHHIFAAQGARNVSFVWNPYQPQDTLYYPGDAYVDWIGLDIFNYGTHAVNGWWADFYSVTKVLYDAFKGYDKPLLLAEVGCGAGGGNRANWFRDMFHYLAVNNFPQVRGLVLFDTPRGKTPSGMVVDLGFSSQSDVYAAIDKKELIDQLKIRSK